MNKMSPVVKIPRNHLTCVKKIGSGGFGDIFHMRWQRETGDGMDVAAKRLGEVDKNELEIMSMLDHPNIVRLLGVVDEPMDFMLILELCEGGSLRDYLDSHGREPLSPELFKRWSKQAARAIEYLQGVDVVHKDIKSQNFVISGDNIKLIDFGLSKNIAKTLSNATHGGTYAYMAPELLKEGKLSSTKFDIFAYAVVLWEMLSGQLPYQGMEYPQILMHVCQDNRRLQIPAGCPMYLAELLNLCWLEEYTKRPSIQQVISYLETKKGLIHGTWKVDNQFAHTTDDQNLTNTHRLHQACTITLHGNGDIAVFDCFDVQGHVYDKAGRYKFSLGEVTPGKHVSHYDLQSIAAAPGVNGNYFVASGKSSPYVNIYDVTGVHLGRFKVEMNTLDVCSYEHATPMATPMVTPMATPMSISTSMVTPMATPMATCITKGVMFLSGMTFDRLGNLLVGVSNSRNSHFISKHMPSGRRIACIPTEYRAQWLAVTHLDTIVYTYPWGPKKATIIDQTGRVLCNLAPPTSVKKWRPTGVCCSHDTIFVANDERFAPDEYGVYCYTLAGEYLGCATHEVVNPTGLALSDNGDKLLVALYESGNPTEEHDMHGVKVFCRRNNSDDN